ncbi:MAG: SCO family protein [Rubrivivax sp.]|nr:SCO family protein [Rubrivivax sp.]
MVDPHRRLIALALAAWALAGCDRGSPAAAQFKAIDITGAEYARDFDLADADGQRRRLADFKGRIAVVFFGYTQCPDVCPTTLTELAAVKQALGAEGARVQGIFVTIDPERDTPEVLKAYVGSFGSDFVALHGNAEETRAVAKHFKVFYAKVPGRAEGSYTMDHTAGSYVFDAQGRVRLFTRYGTGAEALKQDLQLLLKAR